MEGVIKRPAANVIDLKSLEARCLGRLELVERVLGKFAAQLDADLAVMEEALRGQDADAVRAVAHRLKGMSANVEAWPLHECAKEAEELALGNCLEDVAERLEQLREMRAKLSDTLRNQVSSRSINHRP